MVVTRKALESDFEAVFKLFKLFKGLDISNTSKEDFRQLFINHWGSEENYFGYVLERDGFIVGYLGTIFSRRVIDSKTHKVCNLSSWIVEKEYRTYSVNLLMHIMRMKNYVITVFTANNTVSALLSKIGFKKLDSAIFIFPPLPMFKTISAIFKYKFLFDKKKNTKFFTKKPFSDI